MNEKGWLMMHVKIIEVGAPFLFEDVEYINQGHLSPMQAVKCLRNE